ncbi:MAG: acyl-CoA dehydrogenase family protein [Lachnospiraceae bacterium]|nr:acyl-CoA dehydrogenase family protein [Lachnospiraceae bacterium]
MAIEYLLATEEQKELANLAGEIARNELEPRLEELENANGGLGEYPWDIHMKFVEAGFYTMNMPEAWGGLELDNVTRGLILEEISKVDCAFAFSLRGLGDKFNLIIDSHIPEEDKKKWIDRMLNEGIGGAFGLTEPGAGSDSKAIRTTAVKDGDEWVINGTKCFITNGSIADFYGIFAWTDKTKKASEGITCFLVEKERGVKVSKQENKMGFHLSPTTELVLEDVRVPEDHIVGELGKGFSTAMGALDTARPFNSVFAVGAAQRAVDIARKYANERETFGKKIIEHQAVAFQLADLQMKVDAARAMTYYALQAGDAGVPLKRLASEAKAFPTELCQQVAVDALQILGGYGYMKEYPLEKIMRDMRLFTIFGGTNEIQRIVISRFMKDKVR